MIDKPNINTAYYEEVVNMKGYYERYSYVLVMPDGKKLRFVTDKEAEEYLAEERSEYYEEEDNI